MHVSFSKGKLFVRQFLVISPLFFSCYNCIPFRSRSRPVSDGSGSEQTVSAAPAPTKMCRLRRLRLRIPGFDHISQTNDDHFAIFTDSLSSVQLLQNISSNAPLRIAILEKIEESRQGGKIIVTSGMGPQSRRSEGKLGSRPSRKGSGPRGPG